MGHLKVESVCVVEGGIVDVDAVGVVAFAYEHETLGPDAGGARRVRIGARSRQRLSVLLEPCVTKHLSTQDPVSTAKQPRCDHLGKFPPLLAE